MAKKKIEVDVDIDVNAEPSLKQLRELKKQLKETAAGSAEFKKIANEIDDLEDKLKGAKAGAADWIDTLENAGGPLGLLGKGLNNTKVAFSSFNTALKASVIGIIVRDGYDCSPLCYKGDWNVLFGSIRSIHIY